MGKYIIKRMIACIPLLFMITIITFLIINLAPGDPVNMYINTESKSQVDLELIRKELGLDKPMHIRYIKWVERLLHGDFGVSYFHRRPVIDIFKEVIPNTILLSFTSMLLSLLISIPIGIYSAVNKNNWKDYLFSTFSFAGVSVPSFWFALMMILIFSLKLGWFPTSGLRSNYDVFVLQDRLHHLILPSIVLALGSTATNVRYMRNAMLEVLDQDYIQTAMSKGLPYRKVVLKHAFRNALLPVITLVGFMIPGLISGAAIVETIFAWPGLGRVLIEANFTRDYPIIMGELIIFSVMVIVGSLIADVLYAFADPRIKYE